MQHHQDQAQVKQWISKKQANEVKLADDLLRLFNEELTLIRNIRSMAKRAITELEFLRKDPQGKGLFEQAWGKESPNLKVAQEYGNIDNIAQNIGHLRAEYCSDIIRLYGDVVERGRKAKHKQYPGLDDKKGKLRKDWAHAKAPGEVSAGASLIWNDKKGGRRLRDIDKGQTSESPVRKGILAKKGGISIFKMREESTVLKIDRMFGLLEGADISGTTADTMFFINRFGDVGLDPIYHLLPVATIVAGGHHSVLEVSLPLTLNRYIDYTIGLYSTLMPFNSNHPSQGAIWKYLKLAENNSNNRLMLVFFKDQEPGGCYEFDKNQPGCFKLLARADDNMMQTFASLPGGARPKEQDVLKLINLYSGN